MRREDWPQRLAAFIESRRLQPFAWGENDCVTFAADCARELTGTDPIAELRGSWRTALEAARVLDELGGLRAAVTQWQGDELPPALAQRGDAVLVEQLGRELLGVCVGDQIVAPGEHGAVWLPISAAVAAWRV